ncbi:MarR family winged helix-turn-helix transcriptional regulator [Virgibacillus sp. W0181]|uniref:MarR family winged helix-turn-helix transcriptional regulator n=1 Tax=Virgibacillus sp. W0181 TaxID=3391581 RepID=UPI003F480AC5
MIENEIRELLQTLNKQTRRKYAEKFRDINLHVGQESALCVLWEEDGITQTELRKQIGCEASTLSNMLRKLEQNNIVYRKQAENDARSINVFLTQKGKELQEPVSKIWETQQTKLLEGILPEELLLMRRILQQMTSNMMKAN